MLQYYVKMAINIIMSGEKLDQFISKTETKIFTVLNLCKTKQKKEVVA